MALLLDHYLDNLSTLPRDLAKNLQGIRKYDIECQKRAAEIDQKLKLFIKSYQKMPKNAAVSFNKDIMAVFGEIERLSNEKIRLASDTYELVDKHIRRLDNDSAKVQATIRQKYLDAATTAASAASAAVTAGTAAAATTSNIGDETTLERKRKSAAGRRDKKKVKDDILAQKSAGPVSSPFKSFLEGPPILEMPVDPNEPTYCVCHQVSYGEMVMCDNKQCPIEWFHFQCVGLTEPPKGKWYCERCTEQRKKKNISGGNK